MKPCEQSIAKCRVVPVVKINRVDDVAPLATALIAGGLPIVEITLRTDCALDAIRAATYWPAKMMKVSDQWGTVTPGKYADIIAVRGDVLKHINLLQRVDFVMKGGVVYKQDGVALTD